MAGASPFAGRLLLYGELVRLTGSAVVELNRAIAVAETDGGEAGLALVDRLELDD